MQGHRLCWQQRRCREEVVQHCDMKWISLQSLLTVFVPTVDACRTPVAAISTLTIYVFVCTTFVIVPAFHTPLCSISQPTSDFPAVTHPSSLSYEIYIYSRTFLGGSSAASFPIFRADPTNSVCTEHHMRFANAQSSSYIHTYHDHCRCPIHYHLPPVSRYHVPSRPD